MKETKTRTVRILDKCQDVYPKMPPIQQTQGNARHSTQLRAISHKHRKYHWIPRGPENLPVDQLPAEIFLNILLKIMRHIKVYGEITRTLRSIALYREI